MRGAGPERSSLEAAAAGAGCAGLPHPPGRLSPALPPAALPASPHGVSAAGPGPMGCLQPAPAPRGARGRPRPGPAHRERALRPRRLGSRCAFPSQGRPGFALSIYRPFPFPDGKCIPLMFADYSEA